jgi:ribosomal protein S18 acetylase RimI-like enzyme
MPALMPITRELAGTYKQVRLRALQDSPSAFGSTYARESLMTDEDWLNRTLGLDGEKKIGFLAMDADEACGLVACFRDESDPSQGHVISMWVAPSHRGAGVSAALLDAVRCWAESRGISALRLMAVGNNDRAIAFYERYGFVKTGRTEPYPNDPALFEYEMVRPTGD